MAKRKIKQRGPRTANRPGQSLEETVARIQQMLDPKSTVTRNERLVDRVGNRREFDVVIRGSFGGRSVLGVVECKDHSRKKGPSDVEAFAKKSENLNANFRMIVSKKGFTPAALRLATHEGIGCLSLLPDNPKLVGFGIGDMWYGVKLAPRCKLTIHFARKKAPEIRFGPLDVRYRGGLVLKWFLDQFYKQMPQNPLEYVDTSLQCTVAFKRRRRIAIGEEKHTVSGITAVIECSVQKLRKFVTWSGDAFFDWHTGKFTIPASGVLVGSTIDTHMEDWEAFDGEIPIEGSEIGFCRGLFVSRTELPGPTPDLSNL